MATNTTLTALRDMLRAEIGASASPSMGVNAVQQMNYLLARTQERLWTEFDWPHLIIDRDEDLLAGQRYYDFPADVDQNRIQSVHVKYSNTWRPLNYGIDTRHYNALDPERDMRQDPVQHWKHAENGQFEVWPVPASSEDKVRFRTIKKLRPLVGDTDRCDLDDKLIVLFTAAEMLAHAKAADAGSKLSLANAHYIRLRGLSAKTDVTVYGGRVDQHKPLRLMGGRILPGQNNGVPGS
jgi:hypothetical protein